MLVKHKLLFYVARSQAFSNLMEKYKVEDDQHL